MRSLYHNVQKAQVVDVKIFACPILFRGRDHPEAHAGSRSSARVSDSSRVSRICSGDLQFSDAPPDQALGLARRALALFHASDLVDADAVHLLRPELELEALAHHASKESAHRMLLPARGFHHRSNRRTGGRLQHRDDARLLRAPDRLYTAAGDWPLPATTALRQSFRCVLSEVIASSQTLTSRSSVSVDGGVAPHHQSPTSANEPAGQDLGARHALGIDTVPLQARPNASPFWIIMLLLVSGRPCCGDTEVVGLLAH